MKRPFPLNAVTYMAGVAVVVLTAACQPDAGTGVAASPKEGATILSVASSVQPTTGSGWSVYTSTTYGFSIGYPASFVVQSTQNPDGTLPPGRVLEMRAVDTRYEGGYPPGEVDFGVYVKDADSLTGWIQKHTGPCASSLSSMFYWDASSNLVSTSAGGRDVVTFDWLHPCGQTYPLHESVTFLGASYVLRINAWYSNPSYAPTVEQTARAMLASVKT